MAHCLGEIYLSSPVQCITNSDDNEIINLFLSLSIQILQRPFSFPTSISVSISFRRSGLM